MAGVVAAGLMLAVVQWLLVHWWILLIVVVLAAGGGALWLVQARQRAEWERVRARALRMRIAEIDALDHSAFEFAIRDLMRRDGCEADRLGGAGDNACDVRAVDPAGRVWAIQCKHRRDGDRGSAVGTGVLQQVNGTARQIHKADIAVVLTNGRFSSKAVPPGANRTGSTSSTAACSASGPPAPARCGTCSTVCRPRAAPPPCRGVPVAGRSAGGRVPLEQWRALGRTPARRPAPGSPPR